MTEPTATVEEPSYSAMELNFIHFYTTPDSETYHNGTQSCIKAGYSAKTADRAAYNILQKGKIQRRIASLESQLNPPAPESGPPTDRDSMFLQLWKSFNETDNESVKATILNQMRDKIGRAHV